MGRGSAKYRIADFARLAAIVAVPLARGTSGAMQSDSGACCSVRCVYYGTNGGRVNRMDEHLRQRISISPGTMVGKAVIRGTRVPVDLIVRMLAHGASEQEIMDEYPG